MLKILPSIIFALAFMSVACHPPKPTAAVTKDISPQRSHGISCSLTKYGDAMTGYANQRLPKRVGPDAGPQAVAPPNTGRPVGFGVEVVFDLSNSEYDVTRVRIKRTVTQRTLTLRSLATDGTFKPVTNRLNDQQDSPNADNVQVISDGQGRKLIKVGDAPGVVTPLVIDDARSYPIAMNADFHLELQYNDKAIAAVDYHIDVASQQRGADNTGRLLAVSDSCEN